MSTPDTVPGGRSVKTLAIRLEPDLHAQLSLIAQLRGSTITEEIREAIDRHIAAIKDSPELAGKADSVLADIERDAAARRGAIAALFGSTTADTPAPASQARGARSRPPGSTEVTG